MSRLFHENILRFEGAVFNSRPMMIVTEFLEHPAADEFLRTHRREYSPSQLIGMMRQVCCGMKYLVEQGFVHRDLAAKNISCNSQLLCKIADFSMCQKLAETQFVLPVLFYYFILINSPAKSSHLTSSCQKSILLKNRSFFVNLELLIFRGIFYVFHSAQAFQVVAYNTICWKN